MIDIDELQNRIVELERENIYLKALLDHAGISYTQNVSVTNASQEFFDSNQGGRIIPIQITHNHV